MKNNIHKGTELNNVSETWDRNEQNRQSEPWTDEGGKSENVTEESDFDKLIKKEAAAYDNENKEARLLSGDRATVNDDHRNEVTNE